MVFGLVDGFGTDYVSASSCWAEMRRNTNSFKTLTDILYCNNQMVPPVIEVTLFASCPINILALHLGCTVFLLSLFSANI
jgi:hypothetical protein